MDTNWMPCDKGMQILKITFVIGGDCALDGKFNVQK